MSNRTVRLWGKGVVDLDKDYEVLQGAEEFYYEGNEIGVLVIHGFTGTTQSMAYVGERFATEGFTVFGPRLTGHGTNPKDMELSTYEDWVSDVEAGLKKLNGICTSVFVVGLSMGGTLTLYLAENHPEIAGIMPINAAVHMPEFEEVYESLKGSERFLDGIGSDIKAEGVKELAYAKTPVKAIGEIIKLMAIVKEELSKIKIPTLVFSSTIDNVVPTENSQFIYDAVRTDKKELVKLPNSYHVATLDNDKELIADRCIAFMKACLT